MDNGFWEKLKRPIMALAPMANVTDAAFRRVIAKYGKPDVMFTEFISADGLISAGRERLLVDLMYSESERPIVAQLFSGNPEKMFEAAKLIGELRFDGLDINMGCPDRSIEKSGAGAALIKNPRLAREVIRAAKEGSGLPVSIKTRIGYGKDILEEWLPELLAEKPAAITLHARTRKEMSKVPARWDRVKRAVGIRDAFFSSPPARGGDERGGGSNTLILGNGDVMSLEDAREKAKETGADGIMLGRAIFGNPWLFDGGERSNLSADGRFDLKEPAREARLRVLLLHTKLFEQLLGKHKNFAIMKKHFKAYAASPGEPGRPREGILGAKELRMKLMEAENALEVERIIEGYLGSV